MTAAPSNSVSWICTLTLLAAIACGDDEVALDCPRPPDRSIAADAPLAPDSAPGVDGAATPDSAPAPDQGSKLPAGYKPRPCTKVGQPCDAGDTCAVKPMCGKDKKCWPVSIKDCSDGVSCTADTCATSGACVNSPKPGWCAIPVATRASDAGAPGPQITCFKHGDKNPALPCSGCVSAGGDGGLTGATTWTALTGASCDDGAACTRDDTCQGGVCKGTDYSATCDDGLACTTGACDGKGGCLPAVVKAGHCLINNTCYKAGARDLTGCNECDPAKNAKGWTAAKVDCTIGGACFAKGDKLAGGCAECDPAKSKTAWTPKGSTHCLYYGLCVKAGFKDLLGCDQCDPATSQTKLTPVQGLCKISGICRAKGDKNSGGCAECDPSANATGWTVKGTSSCLIGGVCKKPGDKDSTGCKECAPTKDKYGYSPSATSCQIDGKCYASGAKNSGGCAECAPSVSKTGWTVKGTTACLIDNTCRKAGAKDSISCGLCSPGKNSYGWTPGPGLCKIAGVCYKSGAQHPGKCASCDPSKSQTAWTLGATSACLLDGVCRKAGEMDATGCKVCTPSASKTAWSDVPGKCFIDGACHAKGAKHPAGCGACAPAASKTAWTVTAGKCLVGGECHASGAKTADGCGVCAPGTSATSWTVSTSGCRIDSTCFAANAKEPGGCGTCVPAKSKTAWTRPAACRAALVWSRTVGGVSKEFGLAAAVDPGGNVYMAGTFSSASIAFGGKVHTSAGKADIFLVSFSPSGVLRWSKTFGASSDDGVGDLAVDAHGNIYLLGQYGNYSATTISFGGGTLTSSKSLDVYLASFTSAGKHRWSKSFDGGWLDYGRGLDLDSAGNVYITGVYGDTYYGDWITIGGTTLKTKGSDDIFLASFTSTGVHRWTKGYGSGGLDEGMDVAADAGGNIYLVGDACGGGQKYSVNLGGGAIPCNMYGDVILASYTSAGKHRWSKVFGDYSWDKANGVAVDGLGNVYITGFFGSNPGPYYPGVDFGGGKLKSVGGFDIFLASYSSGGTHRWSKRFGGSGHDYGYGLAVDGQGNVLLSGEANAGVNMGGGILANAGKLDMFAAGFTSGGVHRWSRMHGTAGVDESGRLAGGKDGSVVVPGYHSGTVSFGGAKHTGKGWYDAFVIKLGQ